MYFPNFGGFNEMNEINNIYMYIYMYTVSNIRHTLVGIKLLITQI